MLSKDLFEPKKTGPLTPIMQTVIIAGLFCVMVAKYYFEEKNFGRIGPGSTFPVSLLFVPIYEEVLFRGILLGYFENQTSKIKAVTLVSILFGIWHLKNVFWFEPEFLAHQLIYTTFVFSPVACFVTLRLRSLWPAVIFHYVNNLVF